MVVVGSRWSTLSDAQRQAATDRVDLLAERGPDPGRPGAWNDWYAWAVPLADDLYDEYLREPGEEELRASSR